MNELWSELQGDNKGVEGIRGIRNQNMYHYKSPTSTWPERLLLKEADPGIKESRLKFAVEAFSRRALSSDKTKI